MKHYDSIVIGAGPAGASCALYLVRFGLKTALVEKLATGGLLLQTSEIENFPGHPKSIAGYELADALEEHLSGYELDRFSDAVTEVDFSGPEKKIKLADEWISAKTIVIASGVKYRKLGVENEDKYLGRGLSHCALCDGNFFRDQVIAVVGGGNSALEEALYLTRIVKHVHLIHRREEFRASKVYVDKVTEHPKITIEPSSIITALHGKETLEGISVKRLESGLEENLPVTGLFVFVGFEAVTDFLSEDLEMDSNKFIVTDTEMRTSQPGVFAAGDVRSKLCRQVATAVGDGVTAANSVHLYLE